MMAHALALLSGLCAICSLIACMVAAYVAERRTMGGDVTVLMQAFGWAISMSILSFVLATAAKYL